MFAVTCACKSVWQSYTRIAIYTVIIMTQVCGPPPVNRELSERELLDIRVKRKMKLKTLIVERTDKVVVHVHKFKK